MTIEADDGLPGFRIAAEVRSHGVTGVEMEALTAVSVAGLTLFDMLKAVDRTMEIGGIAVTVEDRRQIGDLVISFDEALALVAGVGEAARRRDGDAGRGQGPGCSPRR